ncbi:MAG: DUF1566 domain-containing protein [Pseudomonadota bacterium]|nr:DUF1566 domain-containing protein [Pseudomonadota bacterium]MDP1903819.1 DUF1566 domain-containing protein [Pseudomonadota bacterium]MDP2353485.1 DUF1566 domain-containing protein [Pseudomonadota bacterium]
MAVRSRSHLLTLSLLTAVLALSLGACSNSTSIPAAGGVTLAGAGQKGPYLPGASVTAYQLNAGAARTATSQAGTIDANGHYSLVGIPWTGLTEIVVSGRYFDEAANADSAGTLDLTALIDLQAGATVRVNLLTHLLAGRIRVLMAGSQTYAAARTQALADLATRFNLTLAGGVGPEALDLTDGAGAHAQDNANLLLLSAAVLAGGQGSQTEIDALRADFADNGRIDQAGFNAIRRAARAQNFATLRTRLMTRNAAFANPPGSINQLPTWSLGGSLTDTGITTSQCYQAGSNTLVSCASAEAQALSTTQDGMTGRDADPATNSDADGKLGFSYSKLGGDGQPLTIQNGTYSEAGSEAAGTKWSCVKDNLTGLTWEVKTDDGGLRDKDNTYTNYDDRSQPQRWNGSTFVNPTQAEIDAATNSRSFVAAVNAAGMCGTGNWRLPTVDELQGLVDYSVASPGPTLDANFFPNTPGTTFWTSSLYAEHSYFVWAVGFNYGSVGGGYRVGDGAVRLVHASQDWD